VSTGAADTPEVAVSRFVVVGAGITGLVAARRLLAAGAHVTVLEASRRVGGQFRTVGFADRLVDVGAEALSTAAPGPLALIEELGLQGRLVAAARGTTWIWGPRGLRPLPAGFGPAGPSRLWPMVTARVLSPAGILRAGLEPLVPRTVRDDDLAVGRYLAHRFGRQVTERLIDPLLGGLHAGDVDRLSLDAATPQLAHLARNHRSLLRRRRPPPPTGPVFVSLRGGMTALPERLAAGLRDGDLHLGVEVASLGRGPGGQTTVHTVDGSTVEADGVVLALPARAAADVVSATSPTAATTLRELRAATVAVAVLRYPTRVATTPALQGGTGLLVPSTAGRLLKAATFLTSKWPHLRDAPAGSRHDGEVLLRASAGRIDDDRVAALSDDQLVARLQAELRAATGIADDPIEITVHRWPVTMPQLEVGHRDRLAAVTTALARDVGPVAVAGAPYHGPGIAACLRSGSDAADQLLAVHRPRTYASTPQPPDPA
jgi:protoporphyrinogen/coproporphyrinogen III oxidase